MTPSERHMLALLTEALPSVIDPETTAQAAFVLMVMALSQMEDSQQRDQLVASLSTEAQNRIQTLMAERDQISHGHNVTH
jgi:hypothetical protein